MNRCSCNIFLRFSLIRSRLPKKTIPNRFYMISMQLRVTPTMHNIAHSTNKQTNTATLKTNRNLIDIVHHCRQGHSILIRATLEKSSVGILTRQSHISKVLWGQTLQWTKKEEMLQERATEGGLIPNWPFGCGAEAWHDARTVDPQSCWCSQPSWFLW